MDREREKGECGEGGECVNGGRECEWRDRGESEWRESGRV